MLILAIENGIFSKCSFRVQIMVIESSPLIKVQSKITIKQCFGNVSKDSYAKHRKCRIIPRYKRRETKSLYPIGFSQILIPLLTTETGYHFHYIRQYTVPKTNKKHIITSSKQRTR